MSCISSTDGVPMGASWAAVLNVGNVSGGTDPTLTAGDSLVALGDMTLVTGAFTTTFANATGLWTYPGSATYASASPTVQIGDGTGSTTIAQNKAAGGTNAHRFEDASVLRWQFVHEGTNEDLWLERFNAAGAFQDRTIVDSGTGLWTYPGSATYASASPTVTLGSGAGQATLVLNKAAANSNVINFQDASVVRWNIEHEGTNENLLINRFNAAGAFQDQTIVASATHLWTYPGSATYNSASPVVQLGASTGSPRLSLLKSDAGTAIVAWEEGTDVWQWEMNAAENFALNRIIGGAFQDQTLISAATHLWTYPSSALYNSANPNIQLGDGTGAPFFTLNQSADEAGYFEIENASTPIGYIYFSTGVPAGAAANGSFCFRMHNAGVGTAIYKRTGGAWVAVA